MSLKIVLIIGCIYMTSIPLSSLMIVGLIPYIKQGAILLCLASFSILAILIHYVTDRDQRAIHRSSLLFPILVLGLFIGIQLVWLPDYSELGMMDVYAPVFLQTAAYPIILLLAGYALRRLEIAKNIKFVILSSFAVYSLTCLACTWNLWNGFQDSSTLQLTFKNYETMGYFNYQLLGDVLCLTAHVMIGLLVFKSRNIKASMIAVLTIGLLFMLNSRASFYIGSFAIIVQLIAIAKNLRRSMTLVGVCTVFLALIYLLSRSYLTESSSQRMFGSLSNATKDDSFVHRYNIVLEALGSLDFRWVFGVYIPEVWKGRGEGIYIHNILSYWESYGAIPFLAFLFLAQHCVRLAIAQTNDTRGTALGLITFTVIQLALAKSYLWPNIWFAIGYVSVVPRENRE